MFSLLLPEDSKRALIAMLLSVLSPSIDDKNMEINKLSYENSLHLGVNFKWKKK